MEECACVPTAPSAKVKSPVIQLLLDLQEANQKNDALQGKLVQLRQELVEAKDAKLVKDQMLAQQTMHVLTIYSNL